MAISLLPDPPSRGDSTNFAAKGDALLSALPGFVTEANALAEDVNAKQAATDAAAAVATEMAGIATSRADIATTKAGEAAASEAAAFAYKGAAATSASNASGSEAAAAASAASVDAKGFATDYAGPAEPPVMWPFMTWADTGNMLLKRRNAAGAEWVTLGSLFPGAYLQNGLDGANADIMLNGVAVAKIDGYGVSSANVPAVSAYSNANQGITPGPRTKVLFPAEHFDIGDRFSVSRFMPNRPGLYWIFSRVKITGVGLGAVAADLYKNGALFACGEIQPPGSSSTAATSIGCLIELNGTTDFVEVYGYTTAGSSLAFTSTSATDACTFSAHFVRALP